MKKLFLFVTFILIGMISFEQTASQYVFSQSIGTYTAISGGTAITPTGTTYLDDYSYGPFNIGFNFTWRGTVFTQFGLNENGFISLGATSPTSSYYSLSTGTSNDVIAAFNYDLYALVANGAEIRYQTLGSAPNRYLVVQYKSYGFYSAGLADFNFQVQLYETTNVVKIVYGTYAGTSISGTLQVGLRGASSADFNNRTTTTNWSATAVGGTNAVTCSYTPPGVIPASGLTFTWTPPLPCASPSAQPTALILTPSPTSITGSFTASASSDSYLVVRSLSSTLSATPVNGTVYPVGTAFGGGLVDYWGSGTTFSSTGLTPSTPYYYFIFAANNSCVGTPPLYLTTSPLIGNISTLAIFPISGTKYIGPTGDFFTLTAAFAYLNANGVNGPLNLVLQSTYVSSVEPAFPIPAIAIPGASATNKVTVYPSATGLSITSASTIGTLNLDGAKYVYFDGRVNATGTTKNMIIENTSTSGYAIGLLNGASYNGIQYCIVKSATSSGANGTISFAGTTGATGNSNNLIDNCEIRDGVSSPLYAIASSGSASPLLYNSNNTISNCLIHDFYAPAGGNPIGIGMFAGSTAWTFSGNSFYMINTQSPTLAVGYNVIFIAAGDGYNILNNYIGGSAPSCGGTPWTLNGNGTPPTIANFIYAIRFQTTALTVNPSTLQGNTISNILLYTNPTAASIFFTGLLSVVGIQNISNNVIGSATGTGSITISVGNGAYASTYEGIDFRGMYGNVMNNTFGSFTITGAAASTSTYALTVRPFSVTPTVQNGTDIVSGNLAGSLTTANSIQTPAMTNPPVQIQALFISSTGSGTMSVANNTVANISNLSSYNGSHVIGIYAAGTGLPNVLNGNTIRDITTTSTSTAIAGIASVVGIYSLNSVPGSIIRSNSIYNLTNTSATAAVGAHGIYTGHAAGNLLIEKNFIHNIGLSTNSTTAQVTGLYLVNGGTYATVKNNMIQLGINPDGSANTSSCIINGIYESTATVDSVLNNSVYIGGAPAAGATGSTYAFNSIVTPAIATPRVYLNNIFFNTRSGGTTGMHYGIKVAGALQFPLGLTSNYNMILSNGAVGAVFGSFNAVDQLTFAAWKGAVGTDIASGNANPNFISPAGNTATANLHVVTPTPIEAAGIALANVTDDFDGQLRSGLTPTDIGADAGNFTLSADANGPNITYVPIGNGIVAATRALTNWATITDNVGVSTGASLPRLYYKKSTEAPAFVGNTSADNGWKYVVASNTVTPFSFTIDYSLLNSALAAGNIIQYFVVAQDAANNLSSWYPMAGSSANPPVQNINLAPANVQSYTIVTSSIPTTITVPGTYSTLTATGGAFDMINQGVLVGNTTINITADVVEPGTVALNAWAEDVPGANYKLVIQPDASTLRTISGTATLAAGTGLIRTNGASRFTINGKTGKLLTFRFTNTTPGSNQPTIQFTNGSINDTLKNCTIESNSSSSTYGTVNIGYNTTVANVVVIMNNDIRDASGGTTGLQAAGIVSASILNTVKIMNNNIYNFNNYGFYASTGVADGAVITGNSFYYNSALANTSAQYCLYLSSTLNNHTISGNYIGGQAPLCGGSAWNNTTTNSIYGIYGSTGIIVPTTISNNTIQNFNLSNVGAASFYGIYMTAGVLNILNNVVGSPSVLTSITSAGTGSFYGIYATPSATAATNVQGNTVSGLSYTSTTNAGILYLMYLSTGLVKIGTTSPNIIGSNTIAGSISYAGTGYIYGIYCSSGNPGNAIENNILGNWSLTGTAGSPYIRGMYIYSANTKKNKIFNIGCTNAGMTPYIYGIYNYGASGVTNEYSNNLISLDGGMATNPAIYGFYDGSYSTSFYNLYYNDFYISGTATGTSSTYAYYRGVAAFYTLNNNIFSNTRVAGGTGLHYAVYVSSAGVWSSNNNDFYSVAGPLGYYGAAQLTMAAWKTATGGDANSQNVDPQFVSSTDLHTVKVELNNAGTNIPAVTTDYAGVTRGNPPDIGAYEFTLTPVVTTFAATLVTNTTATLNGTVLANNELVVTSFEYGLTVAYGSTVAGVPLNITGTTLTNFSAALTGLTSCTIYHYRAKGMVGSTPYVGSDMTFNTLCPPTVITTAAIPVGTTTATLNGTVNANNFATTVSFDYGLTVAYGTNVAGVPPIISGNTTQGSLYNVIGLTPVTLYHFRINGTNAGGTINGNDMTFTTAAAPPTVTTTAANPVGTTTATLNGIVNANNSSTAVSFDWGSTIAYGNTIAGTPTPVTGTANSNVSAGLFGLTVGATYHFRVKGINAAGTSNGGDMSFTTGCPQPGAAGTITGPVNVCINGTGYVYTVPVIANATTYNWTLPTGGSVTAGGGTNSITVSYSAVATSGNVTVYGSSVCGSGTVSPNLAVTVNAQPTPTVSGPATPCALSTGNVYTTQAGMTGYVWTLSAGGTIIAGAGTNSITVTWNTVGAQTVCVNYFNANGCTASTPGCYNVTVNALPTPTITGPASLCVNATGNVYTTQAGMTNYTWTVSAGGTITTGGTPTSNTVTVTWSTTGAKTVCVNYTNANGCTASAPGCYNVTVNALPTPTITGTSTVCQGTAGLVYTTQAAMTGYVWTITAGGTITAGSGTNSITVTWNNSGAQTVGVNYTNANGCIGAAAASFPVTVNATPVPTIGSNNAPCVGSTGNMYYTEGGMANYIWAVSAGGAIVSGQGTNAINVTWTGVGAQWVSVNYTNAATCTAPTATVYNLFVNPLPNAAGAITGTATLCAGTNGVAYSCSDILNATSYTWTLPVGAVIATGAGTKSITVNFDATAVSGNITIAGTNSCGNGAVSPAFAVTVNPLPAAAGTITGSASVCAGATGVAYSVPTIANATSYIWTVPAGATITSGGTTRNIVVTFGPAAGTGVITVKGSNACGSGTVSTNFNVTINALPSAPVVTVVGAVLTSSAPSGNQWYYEGNAIAGATGQTYTVTHNTGYYWCMVTLNGCSSPISNKVWVVITGEQELQNNNFSVYPVPNDGRFTVSIISPVQETFTIVVYNQIGAKIFELGDVQVNGTFEKQIDLRPVANGIYSVVFLNSEHKVVRKVLVNK